MTTIYLRNETKAGECRSPLTPQGAKTLLDNGIKVFVESSESRIFSDQEYRELGANMTTIPWQKMPTDTLILGLKELPRSDEAVAHDHVYFSHALKGQSEAGQILARFKNGGGRIFDIEFLTDDRGARVAGFSYWAGFIGAGLGLLGFAHYQKQREPFPAVCPFTNEARFVEVIKQQLGNDIHHLNVMVMGARGRSGGGAVNLLQAVGVRAPALWDKQEYDQAQKPITAILSQDIFINCVYLKGDIPPMIDRSLLAENSKLRIISDVSCDPNSANNPIPVYTAATSIKRPFVMASGTEKQPVYVQAIDHLPTLLPRESSNAFAEALLPYLLQTGMQGMNSSVWQKAVNIFYKASND